MVSFARYLIREDISHMPAMIIDGKNVADRMQAQIAAEAARFAAKYGYPPGLGVVLAGDDPASAQYVRMKSRACERVGITSVSHLMNASSTQAEVEEAIASLNADPKVHGILVQLPLPKGINEEAALRLVSLDKDVD